MLAQQETETVPATRGSALMSALTHPLPRQQKIAAYLALVPFAAGAIWVALFAAYAAEWPVAVIYTVAAIALVSVPLVLVRERWARWVVAAARAIVAVNLVAMFLVFVAAADAPVWVPITMYGGLIGVGAAVIAGKATTYRGALRNE
ncbi:hypothetical protein [Demequina sp. SO4-18]|uniref:hypothetical protein n=1 Tax=Demequina sp. SO4-18 TaxID=3401026 RepID=UPI003B5A3CD4